MGEGIPTTDLTIEPLGLVGACLIRYRVLEDERGHFARTFSRSEFEAAGLESTVEQCNISYTSRRGTLRGLHFQAEPHGEAKLIQCTRGAVFDVGVDIRPDSPTYCRSIWVELNCDVPTSLYLPAGVAHGFLTLADDVEMQYQMSHPYVPESARGVRWDDPAFRIEWPEPVRIVSERDQGFPDFVL